MLRRETVVTEYPRRVRNHLRLATKRVQSLLFWKAWEGLTLLGSMHYKE